MLALITLQVDYMIDYMNVECLRAITIDRALYEYYYYYCSYCYYYYCNYYFIIVVIIIILVVVIITNSNISIVITIIS